MGTANMASVVPMENAATWENGFCECFSMKGAGCVPCCCPNFLCPCMPMMWGSAMSQIKGKDYSYMTCCLGAQCCPICTFGYVGKDLASHYGIEDNDCGPCTYPCKGFARAVLFS